MGNNRWHKICFCVRPARKKCKRACSIQEHLTVGHKQYYHIYKQQYYRYKQYYYTSISRVSVAIESIHVVVLEDTRVFFLFVICSYFYFVVVLFCSLCCNYFLSIVLVRFFFHSCSDSSFCSIARLTIAFVIQLFLFYLLLPLFQLLDLLFFFIYFLPWFLYCCSSCSFLGTLSLQHLITIYSSFPCLMLF